jgi:hypothetical protein
VIVRGSCCNGSMGHVNTFGLFIAVTFVSCSDSEEAVDECLVGCCAKRMS